jgi:hypothetical protein
MARIRSIKPSFWTDLSVAGLHRDARLLTIGLISHADDEGRFLATATAIGGNVFPHDELPAKTIRRWRDEVAAAGIIEVYSAGHSEYGYFPNWLKHQKVYKPYPSTLPAPPVSDGGQS